MRTAQSKCVRTGPTKWLDANCCPISFQGTIGVRSPLLLDSVCGLNFPALFYMDFYTLSN